MARYLLDSRFVKAFNTIYYQTLRTEGRPSAPTEERLVLFVTGDDGEPKAVVSRLIWEIGFAPVDTGSLRDGERKQGPGSPIYNVPIEGRACARGAGGDGLMRLVISRRLRRSMCQGKGTASDHDQRGRVEIKAMASAS
jgi:hypothetical protein